MASVVKAEKPLRIHSVKKAVLINYQLYLLVLPAFIYIVLFKYMPMYGLVMAFQDFKPSLGIWGSSFAGFEQFERFFNSPMFWVLIKNTVTISIYTLIAGFPLPIILALGLNYAASVKYKKLVQTVTYAPHFISTIVMVSMIMIFLSPRNGIINVLVTVLGNEPIFFMAEPSWFKHIYVLSGVWQNCGWNSIIYFAAISSIDQSIYEAATIDGASKFKKIIYIDLPSIMPTIIILLILNTGSIMSVGFEKAFLLQNSLNADSSEIISTYVYKVGLVGAEYSFSTAVGLFNSIINFALVLTVNKISAKCSEISLW